MVKDKRMIGTATVDGVDTGQIDPLTGQRVNAEGKPLAHEHRFVPWGSDARFERCSCGMVRRADAVNAATGELNPNPCVQRWGRGPEGALCKTCVHLVRQAQAAVWYKCALRTDLTHGAKTDQRMRWDACARYEAKPAEPAKARKAKLPFVAKQVRQALASTPAIPATQRDTPRFTDGQSVKVIANHGGLYAAQIGVVGVIAKRRQKRLGYRSYNLGYRDAKGHEKIVIVREDDLEPASAERPAESATPAAATPKLTSAQQRALAEWKRRCPNTAYKPTWIDAVFPTRSNAEAALRRSIQALVNLGVFRELPDHRVQLVSGGESEAAQ